MKNAFKKKLFGFTLIELLVVIAIIVLLAALLLPALNKARRTAGKAVCISNLRQIALGIHAYAGDFGGRLPARYSASGQMQLHYARVLGGFVPGQVSGQPPWGTVYLQMHDVNAQITNWRVRVYHCPLANLELPRPRCNEPGCGTGLCNSGWDNHYQMNEKISGRFNGDTGTWVLGPYELSRCPPNMPLVGDGHAQKPATCINFDPWTGIGSKYSNANIVPWMFDPQWNVLLPKSHAGVFNVVFVDGHAESIAPGPNLGATITNVFSPNYQ
jgi:prepilin-type N-terminal cleavage/methylation domain-containing protein/prepilin-type processing-associated H-X9-DG protein